ncbi:hypothetical protein B0J13DRAFT_205612 [Dactylonectria estremocensis]|uniref:DUF7580 domain-containing protein n=1 Tax=Dactylonectria estremocensis TaxID=1079267 RepID=A0A9P9DCX2_9HYPO|nr:hypothetical protein B0J13DRAFT_205612 [Dactylonectria estremocensis]
MKERTSGIPYAFTHLQSDSQPSIGEKTPAVRVVSCMEPDVETDSWREDDPLRLECLCCCIQELNSFWKTYIRHLEVDDHNLLHEHQCLEESDDFPNQEFGLPALFRAISHTETGKVILGMQLAHALSCLYDGDWLIGGWRQENLSLFKWGTQVPCKLWLKVSLPPEPKSKDQRLSGHHRFPQILELGIILLELHIGETMESYLRTKPAENPGGRWAMALKVFKKNENHILSDDYRRALSFCLKPTFGQLSLTEVVKQPELVRQFIYENVVMRLEQVIAKSRRSPEFFDTLNLDETMRSFAPTTPNRSLPRERRPGSTKATYRPLDVQRPLRVVQADEVITVTEIEEDFKLFGDDCEPQLNTERSRVSDAWIKTFRKIVKDRLKEEKDASDTVRVKVAVLDTGIDLKHIDFDGQYKTRQIKSVRS